MVSLIDVAPTILGCAGVTVPPVMQGRDLLCSLRSAEEPFDAMISQYGKRRYSVRTRDWKLIEVTDPPSLEL